MMKPILFEFQVFDGMLVYQFWIRTKIIEIRRSKKLEFSKFEGTCSEQLHWIRLSSPRSENYIGRLNERVNIVSIQKEKKRSFWVEAKDYVEEK